MASSYPSTFDNFTNPTASDNTNSATVPHATQHANANDAIEALQRKVGLSTAAFGSSSPSTSPGDVLLVNSTGGHTAWGAPSVPDNRVVNGDFQVWQRGSSTSHLSTADNAYTADRWRLLIGGAGAGRVSRESTDVPGGGSRFAAKVWIDGAGNKVGLFTPLEAGDIWDLRGQVASLQIKLKSTSTALNDLRVALVQSTGTADSISGDPISSWEAAGSNPTLAAPWMYVNTPANLGVSTAWSTAPHKIENQSINSSASNLGVLVFSNSTANSTTDFFLVTDVQVNRGEHCTRFARRPFAQELRRCQRYYTKTFPYATAPAQNSGDFSNALGYVAYIAGVNNATVMWRFPVPMRAAPTITYFNPLAANDKWRNTADAGDSGTPVTYLSGETQVNVINPQVATDGVGEGLILHVTASAEL